MTICFEVALILGLIFVYAGGPPPDVNEAHYLTKAKHYWDPSWCGQDVFLDSANPHLAFYWLFGWITRFGSLTTAAWVGRVVTWGALALGWQRLSWTLLPQRFASIATASLFILFVDQFHLAGEWVVGGVESKAIAYALVFFGLRSIVLGQWRAVWIWFGAASAFHVLVGGWSVVAGALYWLLQGDKRARFSSMVPGLLAGAGLSLLGLVPAVMMASGTSSTVVDAANKIYVFGRLPHHLVFHAFAPQRKVLFGMLLVALAGLSWYLRDRPRWWRVNRFALAALIISSIGVLTDVLHLATIFSSDMAARMLKLYWFRLADVAVPLALALGLAVALHKLARARPAWAQAAWIAVLAGPAVLIGFRFANVQVDFRPRAEMQSRPLDGHGVRRRHRQSRAWRRACRWAQRRTPPDCLFLTPRPQQTFKWYAGRAELACWKDIPQDPKSMVRWWQRLQHVYTLKVVKNGLGSWSDRELAKIAEEYGIDYILVDRTRTSRTLSFPRVYPTPVHPNAYFEVYKIRGGSPSEGG